MIALNKYLDCFFLIVKKIHIVENVKCIDIQSHRGESVKSLMNSEIIILKEFWHLAL